MPGPGHSGPAPDAPGPAVSRRRAEQGLDWFTFFIANLQTGFGPFVSVYLTSERWTQADIGLVLTIGGLVGLFGQVPGGALVDAARSKRAIATAAVIGVGLSAVGLAGSSLFPVILLAWMLHAAASCLLTPAIASMSLGLVGHRGLSRRLGRNASFMSVGSALAAAGMGAIGYWLTSQWVFLVTAALMIPALVALTAIEPRHAGERREAAIPASTASPKQGRTRSWAGILSNRPLLILAGCLALFHMANSAMLPLLAGQLTVRSAEYASALIAACIIVPQIAVALLSPFVGNRAQSWGRRPLLLLGFAALPIRAILFAITPDPHLLVLAQLLDGISAATLGVLVPLIAADVTRRSGGYAVAQGLVGTAMGLGASVSTYLGGAMADRLGTRTAFFGLAILAGVALAAAACLLPETRDDNSDGEARP